MDAFRTSQTAFFRRPAGLAAILAAATLLWACGDQNLFGPSRQAPPEVVNIEVSPSEVRSGQTMDVRARAVGNVPLDSVVIRVRGAFSDQSTITVREGTADATVDASFTVPSDVADTTATVSAIAVDAQGNASGIASRTVRIVDTTPPTVSAGLVSEVVALGTSLTVDVEATDNVGLREVGFRAFFTEGDTLVTETAGVSGFRGEHRFEYQVPDDVAEGDLTIEVFATDVDGNSATSTAGTPVQLVFVDEEPPAVSVSLPNEGDGVIDVGEELLVRAEFSDNGSVSELRLQGLGLRGDADLGTDSAVVRFEERVVDFDPPVTDSVINRFLQSVPADSVSEVVHVIATATDAQGNVGADTTTITVQADTDRPNVSITAPTQGRTLSVDDSVVVTADLSDNGGIQTVTMVGVAFRPDPLLGPPIEVVRFQERTVELDPVRQSLTLSRKLVPVPDTITEDVKIAVSATDEWGNVGTDTVTITVEADEDGPDIDIIRPLADAGFPVDDSIFVEVDVSEPADTTASGIRSVLFEGVAFTGSVELGTFTEVQRFEPKEVVFDPLETGTVNIKRFLQPTAETTSTTAFIRITAEDGAGNEVKDSVQIQLGAPGVTIVTPQEGDEVAINGQITVRVEATDPSGIASLEVSDADGNIDLGPDPLISETFSPAETTVSVENTFNVGGSAGIIELTATAVNTNGIVGETGPVVVQVVQQQAADNTAPELRVQYSHQGSPSDIRRMELTDALDLVVEGRDNQSGSGVEEVGVTLQATPRNRNVPTSVIPLGTVQYGTPRSGTFTETISVPVSLLETSGALELISAPDTVDLTLHAFMVDAQDNCGAAISPTEFQSLTCGTLASNDTIASNQSGQPDFMVGVSGETVRLPSGGSIADAVVDEPRNQLVMSNIANGRLEVFDLATRTFGSSVLVGAEPWGLTFDRNTPNRLYVANSAGTNISVVDMTAAGGPSEDSRIFTPNTVLWEVEQTEDVDGNIVLNPPEFIDFSDRPQFIAQDVNENLVYSTLPTTAAPNGTIRLGIVGQGPDTEVILYTDHAALLEADQVFPLGNIDDLTISAAGLDDVISVTDHDVGDRSQTRTSGQFTSPAAALQDLLDNNAEVYANPNPAVSGQWDREAIGLGDTTFVASSGDGNFVAIGEGATAPTGRIMMYTAPNAPATPRDHVGSVSSVVDVEDLLGNQAERVLGVALNRNGSLGVARGLFAVYFFTPADLRLQGSAAVSPGGAGVALHPLHNDGPPNKTNANVRFAFAGTGDNTVEIFDTWHFSKVGSVAIRQQIVGQIRAILPTAADQPAGASCGDEVTIAGEQTKEIFTDADGNNINANLDDECVVLKLTGITDDQGVVVIPVTKADVIRTHPAN